MRRFPTEIEQGDAPPSCLSSHTGVKGHWHGLFYAAFFTGAVILFKMTHKDSAEGLSGVPGGRKAVTGLLEKILTLDEPFQA